MRNMTTFIGIDLAWQSDKNHTGIVVAYGDEAGATAEAAVPAARATFNTDQPPTAVFQKALAAFPQSSLSR